ncbi:MAG: hypothetical protein ABSF91_15510 [Bacteroidota bacterium]|jgi:hypothetical protein
MSNNRSLLYNKVALLFSARTRAVFLFAAAVVVGLSCTGGGGFLPDIPPITRLANLPPGSLQPILTSSNPRLTLYWVGDDPDGYVVGFKYRWTYPINGVIHERPWSTILNIGVVKSGAENFALMLDTTNYTRWLGPGAYNGQTSERYAPAAYKYFATLPPEGLDSSIANALDRGDTLPMQGFRLFASNPANVAFPIHVNPNSGTFIFDSQDSLNNHTFEIEAIDNLGVVGAPAKLSFNTLRVTIPRTQVNAIRYDGNLTQPGDSLLVIDKFTDTFNGIEIDYKGIDPNSRTLQYSWNVDSVKNPDGTLIWSDWTAADSAFVNASDFDPARKYETEHVFSVRCRNEFGAIDTAGFYGNITTGNANNNLQSYTQTVVDRLDMDGSLHLKAGTYALVGQAGTNPGTMMLIYNNGTPVDNIAPQAKHIVVHGGVAGVLTLDANGIPPTFPQVDSVAVVVASVKFYTIFPKFARDPSYRRYLVLNNSYPWSPANVSPSQPSHTMIRSFYSSIFHDLGKDGLYDFYDVPKISTNGTKDFASLGDLANYSTVFVVAETESLYSPIIGGVYGPGDEPFTYTFNASRIRELQTYCNVGGKIVISAVNFLAVTNSDLSVMALIHLSSNPGDYPQREGDFDLGSATADSTKGYGYENAVFDRQKIDTTFCPAGAIRDIWTLKPIGFGERIYFYRSTECDTSTRGLNWTYFDGRVIGTRYQGVTYSVISYGFPLYCCQYWNAKDILQETLIDIGEN